MACASTVAVVVPSPATSEVLEATSRTIWAPMFSSASFSSISLATVTPSLVMTGAPNFFSITAFRPLGPRVIFTASASTLTPRRIAWREFSPVTICFAMSILPPGSFSDCPGGLRLHRRLLFAAGCFGGGADLCEDLVFLQDEIFLVIDDDIVAAVLAKQDAI